MNKQLKNVPEGNKGLKNLPTEVRNKMGYMAKGGAVMKAKGGSVKMASGGPVDKPKRERAKGAEPMKGMKGMKMAGGGMAKGYKAGGVATKGGTKGGVTGGKKMARKRDGIAKRGKTRA